MKMGEKNQIYRLFVSVSESKLKVFDKSAGLLIISQLFKCQHQYNFAPKISVFFNLISFIF